MKVHKLKTWPEFYALIREGRKKFEVRKNDRDFKAGDVLILEEYMPSRNVYSGFVMAFVVDYVMCSGPEFVIEPSGITGGYCVMSLGRRCAVVDIEGGRVIGFEDKIY